MEKISIREWFERSQEKNPESNYFRVPEGVFVGSLQAPCECNFCLCGSCSYDQDSYWVYGGDDGNIYHRTCDKPLPDRFVDFPIMTIDYIIENDNNN